MFITTTDHPFYTDEGEWILAGDLQIGELVVSADGNFGTVDAVVITDSTAEFDMNKKAFVYHDTEVFLWGVISLIVG